MKPKFIMAVVTCLFWTCDKEVYYDIPQNERPLLNDGDTVCFADRNNNIDTFLIKVWDDYVIYDKRYYHEEILIRYLNTDHSGLIEELCVQHGVFSTGISVMGHYFPDIQENDGVSDLEINGITYSEVYYRERPDFPDTLPYSIYYSHRPGILRYDFSDTGYFEIINNMSSQ